MWREVWVFGDRKSGSFHGQCGGFQEFRVGNTNCKGFFFELIYIAYARHDGVETWTANGFVTRETRVQISLLCYQPVAFLW